MTLKDIEKLAVDFQRGKITAEEFKLKTVSETTQLTKNELDELALRITRIGASEGDG